jgi:hypothetical protein
VVNEKKRLLAHLFSPFFDVQIIENDRENQTLP